VDDIIRRVSSYGCPLVEVTGGEPLLQPESIDLMQALVDRGFEVLLETGGSLPIGSVPEGVRRIVDVKCPGSGECDRNCWENLDGLRPGDELKFVIAGRGDYEWAVACVRDRSLCDRAPVLFSAVHEGLSSGQLAEWVIADRLTVRVQMQMHKVLWPTATRGV
jgi:7-carboxy-7-deazaguanine synthase